jgi:hypothetical protein
MLVYTDVPKTSVESALQGLHAPSYGLATGSVVRSPTHCPAPLSSPRYGSACSQVAQLFLASVRRAAQLWAVRVRVRVCVHNERTPEALLTAGVRIRERVHVRARVRAGRRAGGRVGGSSNAASERDVRTRDGRHQASVHAWDRAAGAN